MSNRTDEELKEEHDNAKAEVEDFVEKRRPKNFISGAAGGLGSIVGGAMGAVGVAVVSPYVGMSHGAKKGGFLGGAVGLIGGAGIGMIGGAAMAIEGTVSGVTQIGQGVVAEPKARSAVKQGKWWNDATNEWSQTNLETIDVPDNDDDILKRIEDDLDNQENNTNNRGDTVKDPYYYDVLEIDPKAESGLIKRRYYKLARKYHPDKVEGEEEKKIAAGKFEQIAEAYHVLSDPDLRKAYDELGKEGLSADRTEIMHDNTSEKFNPSLLIAFLFGSDQFKDYIGRLSSSTAAMLGDSAKLSIKEARILQERRCSRLAKKLAAKIKLWTEDREHNAGPCELSWAEEATKLSKASYGWELVKTIGMAYEVSAYQFLGSSESSIGMPSIGRWCHAQKAKMKGKNAERSAQMDAISIEMGARKMEQDYAEMLLEAKTEEERFILMQAMQAEKNDAIIRLVWTTVTVDITSTIHEACQMVFFDQSCEDKNVRTLRAKAVKHLGKIFSACPKPESATGPKSAHELFEEASIAAMAETMKHKDDASHRASFSY